MSVLEETSDLIDVFCNDTALLDVRAPVEFSQGALPGAVNLPILDNEQRHEIGREYAHSGQQAAIDMGLNMATDSVRQQRIDTWTAYIRQHPNVVLYCYRGGLRSRYTQQWLDDTGTRVPRLTGGYKAARRFLLDQLQSCLLYTSDAADE